VTLAMGAARIKMGKPKQEEGWIEGMSKGVRVLEIVKTSEGIISETKCHKSALPLLKTGE
jgi:hypothetical protein